MEGKKRGGNCELTRQKERWWKARRERKMRRKEERTTPPHISSQSGNPFGLSDSTTELNELLH